ncbi:LysE family transporter [Streptomyces sp. NBC_00102]|uniref:LysE family transporter n=1 Tax=Streptomyces sp. NBC_00102 TaxID=2975652 RepID=UPI00225328F3|nr:LysE family transporter [Streptomyces sp. NBC_00102]MCX5398920.1 LysE family transporter [Streptomyces sp. NBC_00102]
MSAALVAGLLAGYGIAVPVGAVAAYLVALTARTSPRVGSGAALGVATADGLYALVATAGGSALAPLLAPVTQPLRWASAAVLAALACRGAVAAVRDHRARQDPVGGPGRRPVGPLRAYLALLGITLLNPVTVVYFTALVLAGRGAAEPGAGEQAVFVLAAFAASATWQLLLVGGGALLGRVLTGPRGRLCTALVSSAVIVGLAAHLLLTPP